MVILDIDMPKSCYECELYDDRWDYPTCFATQESRGYNFNIFEKRMPDCPIIQEVPKYHNGLIDKKDARHAITDMVLDICYDKQQIPIANDAFIAIENVPVIIEEFKKYKGE